MPRAAETLKIPNKTISHTSEKAQRMTGTIVCSKENTVVKSTPDKLPHFPQMSVYPWIRINRYILIVVRPLSKLEIVLFLRLFFAKQHACSKHLRALPIRLNITCVTFLYSFSYAEFYLLSKSHTFFKLFYRLSISKCFFAWSNTAAHPKIVSSKINVIEAV